MTTALALALDVRFRRILDFREVRKKCYKGQDTIKLRGCSEIFELKTVGPK